MASDAQIRANRANAALSTGPRSEEGKARVARNALVHGGCAGMLLPDEDQDAFHTLRSTYEEQYCPADETEHFLVGRLALAAWRLQRLAALEARVVSAQQERANLNTDYVRSVVDVLRGVVRREDAAAVAVPDADAAVLTDPVAHAYIRDSERGDTISKLARYQTSLERSYYRALQQLERRRPAS